MKIGSKRILLGITVVAISCTSPTPGADTYTPPGEEEAPPTDPGDGIDGIQGTAWAPANAPGQVLPGHEIPVSGALIRLSASQPAPIPDIAHCTQCVTINEPHTFSDAHGNFHLPAVEAGSYWLIVEKGLFRRSVQITVPAGGLILSAEQTTLPSVTDESTGDSAPKIALAGGASDQIESILAKAGFGELSSNGEYVYSMDKTYFDIFSNGGWAVDGYAIGTLAELVSDYERMLGYHMIIIPCSGSSNTAALDDQQNLRNLRDYVAAGGRLYVTDWSGEWVDNVFPAQVELQQGDDTPATAYDVETDTWNTSEFGDADGSSYDSHGSQAVDGKLRAWFDGQTGPHGPIDPASFLAEDNWNTIEALHSVTVGVNEEGETVIDKPHIYVRGPSDYSEGMHPLTVTYEPAGCGRVMFSTYHTAPNTHLGLYAQERVLLYLLMEIGMCVEDPVVVVD